MVKLSKFVMLAMALAPPLIAWWARSFVVERRPLNANLIDVTDDQSVPDKDPAIARIENDSRSLDSSERQIVLFDRDPMTGNSFFSVNGSPVQGKLKAYLEDDWAREGDGYLRWCKTICGDESCTWTEIPMPLLLFLTDQESSQ